MSSEYIDDRKAINLQGEKDNYTALFIKSHSSNDGEHTPRWKLYYFSKQQDALPYVAQCAHYCDGGLTRGPGGRPLTGQHEITLWRDAMNSASIINEDSSEKSVDLVFSQKPMIEADSLTTMTAILKIAVAKGLILQSHNAEAGAVPPGRSFMTLNLACATHVDLVWEAINTIKVPSLYGTASMVGLGPYRFFDGVKGALQRGTSYPVDPSPLVTQAEKVQTALLQKYLGNTFLKFDFPVEGQIVYKDRRIVVSNCACRVLSIDPDAWFGKNLAIMEKAQPGCAESAFRAYKRLIKALPVTPVEQIRTVEIRPLNGENSAAEGDSPITSRSLTPWQLDTVKALFGKHGKNLASDALHTSNADEHLAALCMSYLVPCFLAVNASGPALSLW